MLRLLLLLLFGSWDVEVRKDLQLTLVSFLNSCAAIRIIAALPLRGAHPSVFLLKVQI